MTELEKAKTIISWNYKKADSGLFNSHNTEGDFMTTLYHDSDIEINICYDYGYFEVFGLSKDDFAQLEKFYDTL